MTKIYKSALVIYDAARMYDLVDAIDTYPTFLPWCRSSEVLHRQGELVEARIEIAYGKFNKGFTTRNRHIAGQSIEMQLVDGPFRHLRGVWNFTSLGTDGCKISLDMEFEFTSILLGLTAGPIFSQIANSMVDAFTQRAKQIYG
jgi:ribosome-associated toxin RatA of RatAB toxin-antitoxin module